VSATSAALYADPSAPASQIIVDSVASKHMCPNRNWFSEIREYVPRDILFGDDSSLVCRQKARLSWLCKLKKERACAHCRVVERG
jgi:hypothetical protein